jgi:multisubunit Na+/H+ antiporter MnhB subunit
MNEKTSKLIQWFLYIILGLSALLGILFYTNTNGNTELLIYWGYFLGFIVIATALFAMVSSIMRNPKGSVKMLIVIAAMILIFVIAYSVSTNKFTPAELEKLQITASTAKFVGAGLLILYLLGIGALVTVIYTSIAKIIK